MSLPRAFDRAFVCAGLVIMTLIAACGGGGDGGTGPGTTPPPAAGGFTLSAGAVQITQAGSGAATVTVTRSGSFTGAVALTIEGAPSGVTATVAPASVPTGSTAATVQLAVALTVPAGSYPIIVRGTGTGVTAQTATLTLTVATRPASVALTRATSSALTTSAGGVPLTFNVVISRIEFLGEVTLDVASGLPSGVTASFSPNGTTLNTVTATFTVATNTAPGNYTAVLRATGAGIAAATLDVPFTVTGPATVVVGLSRSTVTMPQNGSDATSITLARTNYAGGVTLTLAGVPAGVTAVFGSNPASGNGTALTLTAGAAVAPGTYALTLSASAPGVTGSSVGLTLVITPAGVGGNTTVRFCGPTEDRPIWFGLQVGNSWTRIAAVNDSYTFDFPINGAGTLAWVTQRGADEFQITVTSGLRSEIAETVVAQCLSPSNRTATGTVVGLAALDRADVVLGPRSALPAPTLAMPNFTFTALPDGALDLLASRSVLEAGVGAFVANRVLIQRGINPGNGASVGTLDLASGLTPDTKVLTVQGGGAGETVSVSSSFRSAGGAVLSLGAVTLSGGASTPVRHVPASALQAGDFHLVQGVATATNGSAITTRSVTQVVASPTALTLTLGAAPADVEVAISNFNQQRVRYQTLFPLQADYRRLYTAAWSQQAGATRRSVVILGTQAALPEVNGTHVRVRIPDFDAASGWNVAWELRPNVAVTWVASATGWEAAGGSGPPLANGVVTRSFTRTGTATP